MLLKALTITLLLVTIYPSVIFAEDIKASFTRDKLIWFRGKSITDND